MEILPALKSMGSSTNNSNSEEKFLRTLLQKGAKVILPIIFGGIATFFWSFYRDVQGVLANDAVQDEKIIQVNKSHQSLKAENKDIKNQVNEMHWYLIKRNNVKVPRKDN